MRFSYRLGRPDETMTKEDLWDKCSMFDLHYKIVCAMFRVQRKAFLAWNTALVTTDPNGVGLSLDALLHEMIFFARHGAKDVKLLLKEFEEFPALNNFDKAEFFDTVYTYINHKSVKRYNKRVKRLFAYRNGIH